MSRVVVLIDGFNLYHALDYNPVIGHPQINPRRYKKYKWLNLAELARCFVYNKNDSLADIYYFTTLASWNPVKVAKHQTYIRDLENEGVNVVYGEFKRKQKHCNLCNGDFWTHEEKQTDVNIAVSLLHLAISNAYDKVIVISGDTDLLPAVRAVQTLPVPKPVGVVVPIGKASKDFIKTADFNYRMKETHLQASLLPDPVILPDGSTLTCPPSWK